MRLVLLLCISVHLLSAQKVVQKKIINPAISFIKIDANNCFEIELETSDDNEMSLEASIEGEYKKDLVLSVTEEGKTLFVGAGFQPNFINPNDKLSAHKVVSIGLKIKLPKDKSVSIFGTSANIQVQGNYEALKIVLNDGACALDNVVGLVNVATQSGAIKVSTEAAVIKSQSKYGSIEKQVIPEGEGSHYTLNTITGNILLQRIE